MRFLSQEQAKELLHALKLRSQDVYDEALLSILCGPRAGEIYNLTWGDIDLKNGTVFIRDLKNTRNRYAFISEDVEARLKRRYQEQATTDLIFPTYNGKPRMWVSDTLWLVQQGTPLHTVAELMDHSTIEMTRRYSHLAPDTLRKAAFSLQGHLSE